MNYSFAINSHNQHSIKLSKYNEFFSYFSNKQITMAIISKDGIAYYQGKYTLSSVYKYINIIRNSPYHVDKLNYFNNNAFIINMKNMILKNIIITTNNKVYELTDEELAYNLDIIRTVPSKFRNLFVINSILHNIHIYYDNIWYKCDNL